MFNYIYQNLKSGFNQKQSWIKFLFKNTALANLLNQERTPSAWEFFTTYLSSWWWNRLWFRYCIQATDYVNKFDGILRSLHTLKKVNILTVVNFNAVAAHNDPHGLAQALSCLQEARILTQDNLTLVTTDASPFGLARALSCLQEAQILTQENLALVAAYPYLLIFAHTLTYLQKAQVLTQDNLVLVADHNYIEALFFVLSYLHRAQVLTQESLALVCAHTNPYALESTFKYLQRAQVLTQESLALVCAHTNPHALASTFKCLQGAQILTQDNLALVCAYANPRNLADALTFLQPARILTQDNFMAIVAPNHAALVTDEAHQRIWGRIPNHLLTPDNFQRLLTAAEHANPMEELDQVINQILDVMVPAEINQILDVMVPAEINQIPNHPAQVRANPVVFNPGQSTHTASVHQSVSASAVRLRDSYKGVLENFELKIQEIRAYVNGLDDSHQHHQAAKRCVRRIIETDYTFTDTSGLSIRQLLALAYTGIHDDTKRLGTVEAAKALFVEGLYEIQRGYNLDERGQDQGGDDSPICAAGTFNKLMEKLNGIHQDVNLCFITPDGAGLKFPKLAQAHALSYLQTLACSETAEDYHKMKNFVEGLKEDNTLALIWNRIKESVKKELWDEYKTAYNNPLGESQFLSLIECGQYVKVPDLSAIEATLFTSPGYQAHLDEQACLSLKEQRLILGIERHRLWANRHESIKAQEIFDKQYGLVLKR